MTPAARVQTAIELLDEIIEGTPAEKVMTAWARRSRFAGSKDRAAVRDHVFDVLRRRRSIFHADIPETGRALMQGLLLQDGADLNALFSGDGYGPSVLTEEEQATLAAPVAKDVVDLPDWIQTLLQASLGDKFQENTTAMRSRAPVFLRVNLKISTRQDVIDRLLTDGVTAVASPLADTALEVTEGPRKVQNSSAFQDGEIEVQDASSQAAIAALPLQDGMRVLDYCAGGGGKTLAMGGRIDGTFVVHDAYPQRMRDLSFRADRAGLKIKTMDQEQLEQEPGFDLVFCDVPCSGSGAWRRSPDAKWRLSEDDLADLCETQATILNEASKHVSPESSLVYATCSMLNEENQDQIDRFLKENTGWGCVATFHRSLSDGCDGFFMAQLTKAD